MPPHSENEFEFPSKFPEIRLVAWEVTRRCNLSCLHCRASAESGPYLDELSTEEGFHFMEQIREVGRPVVILTGGNLCFVLTYLIWPNMGILWASGWSWPSTGRCWILKTPLS